jgi:hypothetical protein
MPCSTKWRGWNDSCHQKDSQDEYNQERANYFGQDKLAFTEASPS